MLITYNDEGDLETLYHYIGDGAISNDGTRT